MLCTKLLISPIKMTFKKGTLLGRRGNPTVLNPTDFYLHSNTSENGYDLDISFQKRERKSSSWFFWFITSTFQRRNIWVSIKCSVCLCHGVRVLVVWVRWGLQAGGERCWDRATAQPATCPSGSAGPRTLPPLCSVPQRQAAGPGAPCHSCHRTTTAREPAQDTHRVIICHCLISLHSC